jgi:hypothetical protein
MPGTRASMKHAEDVDLAVGMADRRCEIKRESYDRASKSRSLFDDGKESIQLVEGVGNEQ